MHTLVYPSPLTQNATSKPLLPLSCTQNTLLAWSISFRYAPSTIPTAILEPLFRTQNILYRFAISIPLFPSIIYIKDITLFPIPYSPFPSGNWKGKGRWKLEMENKNGDWNWKVENGKERSCMQLYTCIHERMVLCMVVYVGGSHCGLGHIARRSNICSKYYCWKEHVAVTLDGCYGHEFEGSEESSICATLYIGMYLFLCNCRCIDVCRVLKLMDRKGWVCWYVPIYSCVWYCVWLYV